MVLKKDNVEKIVLDESVAKVMISKGWKYVTPKEVAEEESQDEKQPHDDEPQEKPKRTKKKSEDAE